MPEITTVIFDMYETLVQNPTDTWKTSFAKISADQNLGVTADQIWEHWTVAEEEFRNSRIDPNLPFQSYHDGWRRAFQVAFAALKLDGDPTAATDSFFDDLGRRDPYPETNDAVRLIQKDRRTALLSNADDGFLFPNLKVLDVGFDTVLSSEEARIYKPLPGLFQQMLDKLGVSPEETAYVGDRQFEDVMGSSRVGMRPVWINRDNRPLDPELPAPAHQISSLLELPGLLAQGIA